MTIRFAIFNRWDYSVKFKAEIDCGENSSNHVKLGLAVKWAVQTHADLTEADLTGANLTGVDLARANLTGADLTRADLTSADLTGAKLTSASLDDADLTCANLTGANLTYANLTYANLTDADLTDTDLTRTNLVGATLTRANLIDANLTDVRNDLWDIFIRAHHEMPGLLQALRGGKIDGSVYKGECSCLIGTIAKIRNVDYKRLGDGLHPNSDRPAERLFLGISKGDTPENSALAKIVENWIVEFMALMSNTAAV